MQDIADAAGVSQSTVSRVLTGAPNAIPINPATREAWRGRDPLEFTQREFDLLQVFMRDPLSAPEPPQVSHHSALVTEISFSHPCAASSKLISMS